ncbi:glycosyltransferase [Streptomonospora wellingtoniae]|uniref:4,4'-diaponeurosporenoate glycosyltransferase n=1 Tax=Streptomonospora wellingtoniae TaxID=3075544 RepID=A0ABU2KRT8_9ACTN|nr:glycosyltransferase [Streptomonospora sp. DSM 45055]MDT0301882.1 glycosyltransferase [Streptomonospora sp. DSM 45055]
MIRAAAVVVPANDEAATIERCVRSAAASLAVCGLAAGRCRLVVVADACTDATAELARRAGALVVEASYRSAGAARAAGMRAALEHPCGQRPRSVWLATTDADSTVPRRWLAEHLRYADAGWDAVAGTVTVEDWSHRPPDLAAAFAEAYSWRGREHPHVHGANLGVRASAYIDSGGFGALSRAEDHALVTALHARGHSIRRPADLPVATSAREDARAPGGFGDRLTALARSRPE